MSDTGSIRAQFLLFNFTFSDFTFCVGFVAKVGCVFTIAFGSLLPYSEFGQNDHLEDAPHFSSFSHEYDSCENLAWNNYSKMCIGIVTNFYIWIIDTTLNEI